MKTIVNHIVIENKIPAYFDANENPDRFSKSFNGFPLAKVFEYMNTNLQSLVLTTDNADNFLLPLSVSDNKFELFKNVDIRTENFFYPIGIHWWYSENINTQNNIFKQCLEINPDIVQAVNDNRCKIILYNPFEGWEESFWQKIVDLIIEKYNTFDIEDFIVISNNINIKKIKSIALVDNQQFEQSSGHFNNFDDLHHYIKQSIVNKITRPYKFVALMRRPRPTRWAIMTELFDDRDKGLMSFSIDIDPIDLPADSAEMLNDDYATAIRNDFFVPGSSVNRLLIDFDQAYPNLYDKFFQKGFFMHVPFWIPNDVNPKLNPKKDNSIFKFTDSYLHIVSETYFRNQHANHLHFSEKIFKPIWYLQPFVLFANTGALYNFTRLGYKSFSQWIDETYDQIHDDTERFNAAINAAKNFYLQSDEKLNDIMLEMLPTLLHNFQVLQHNQKNQTQFLIENLAQLSDSSLINSKLK